MVKTYFFGLDLSSKSVKNVLFCCQYFWEKIQPGGYLLVHDYWFPEDKERFASKANFLGVRRAVDGFFERLLHESIIFPETSHAVFRKPLG